MLDYCYAIIAVATLEMLPRADIYADAATPFAAYAAFRHAAAARCFSHCRRIDTLLMPA